MVVVVVGDDDDDDDESVVVLLMCEYAVRSAGTLVCVLLMIGATHQQKRLPIDSSPGRSGC